MIQKKLSELRKKMRTTSMDQYFKEIREKAINKTYNEEFILEPATKEQIVRCMDDLIGMLDAQNYTHVFEGFSFLEGKIMENSRVSWILISEGRRLGEIIKIAIVNCLVEHTPSSLEIEYDRSKEFAFLERVLELLLRMGYLDVEKNGFELLVDSFWTIFRETNFNIYAPSNYEFLTMSLKIVVRMLQYQQKDIFDCLKQVGLGTKLAFIMDSSISSSSNIMISLLIHITELYLLQEVKFHNNSEICEIGGIHIVGMQTNEKTVLMAFCLSIMKMRKQFVYLPVLNSLSIILQKYQFLAMEITVEQIRNQLLEMILFRDRQIRCKSLSVLDQLIYHGKDSIDIFLKDMDLPNMLQEILFQENKINDRFTREIVACITYIICNLSLTKVKNLKNAYLHHPIWQVAYESISPGSPLIELVCVFEYYFNILGKNTSINMLENYVVAVSNLNFSHLDKKIVETIHRTILRTYQNSDFWPEHMQEHLTSTLRNYNLLYIIQELIPEEDSYL